jgi:FkbM family methyltransferase
MPGKSRVVSKSLRAYRLFKDKGFGAVFNAIYIRAKLLSILARLQVEIYIRGRNKVVWLDGCRFNLRELPNTQMKLELLTGRYELPERNAVRRYIQAEWSVIELGGCIGVVASITNRHLKDPKAHVVLEANPLVIPHLNSNRNDNRCSFKILNKALAYNANTVTFGPSQDFWGNSLLHHGGQPPVTVAVTQLREILREEQFEKFALICDIEGLEYELVMQEAKTLCDAELIIMEVHPHMIGEEKVRTLLSTLAELGFKTFDRSGLVVVLGKA